jgi:hypothetical protein
MYFTHQEKMRRYILRQYLHGEPGHDPANVTGTFDELKKAQAFAGMRLRDFNEIIDQNSWEVVWRCNKSVSTPSATPTLVPLHDAFQRPSAWSQRSRRSIA